MGFPFYLLKHQVVHRLTGLEQISCNQGHISFFYSIRLRAVLLF